MAANKWTLVGTGTTETVDSRCRARLLSCSEPQNLDCNNKAAFPEFQVPSQ